MMGKKRFFREKRLSAFCRMLLLPLLFAWVWPPAVYAQYSNLPTMGDAAGSELSPMMEYRIGVEIMRRIQADPDYIEDDVVTEYLNGIGYKLVHAVPEVRGETSNDFFFFALRDPTLNAFALPGGFIGVHTGLLLAAQSESELASVLSHEIGHVSQRHIARMIGNQKQDMLIPIASLVLAAIAGAAKNADAAGALAVGGQGLAIQKQLNFNRDAEREADRIGFLILRGGGFDTTGMVLFFERLQRANRNYGEGVSAYLRTHPLTSERIADIEARVQSEPYRQHADTPDFYYVRIRAQLLQDNSAKGVETASAGFQEMIKTGGRYLASAGYYGQALLALKQDDAARAAALLQEARQLIGEKAAQRSLALTVTAIDIKTASRQYAAAAKDTEAALSRFPSSRALSYQYAGVLYHAGKYDKALAYLRKQAQLYRNDAMIQGLLAKVYGAQGKVALMHLALAESYSLSGGISAALEQLSLARQAPDVTFYDHSIIDAKEREWQKQRLEELAEK
ncbi:MAG: M48 family metalloprotease [Oxalobacter formigenes]|nr:M48 family metalloprotease [Oxalobacter formigenes]